MGLGLRRGDQGFDEAGRRKRAVLLYRQIMVQFGLRRRSLEDGLEIVGDAVGDRSRVGVYDRGDHSFIHEVIDGVLIGLDNCRWGADDRGQPGGPDIGRFCYRLVSELQACETAVENDRPISWAGCVVGRARPQRLGW